MSLRRTHLAAFAAIALTTLLITGCKTAHLSPDYGRPLPPGVDALRKITDPAEMPDPTAAFNGKDADLLTAIDRSTAWFANPSTAKFFPVCGISHNQAYASCIALRELLNTCTSPEQFRQRLYQECDAYISVGWDMHGVVLFTGYYSPVFNASPVRTDEFRYPLYKKPADLVTDAAGNTLGRSVNGAVQTYPTRAEIESSHMLDGTELVWFRDKLDAYIVQVNGSAKLTMPDGSTTYIGYAGNNGHEYNSVGKMLVDAGKLDRNHVSLPTIRAYFHDHPDELDSYVNRNDRFVFFQLYTPDAWPAGSLGFKVTSYRTLATDKTIFPRAGLTLVQTNVPTDAGQQRTFDQFMLDQDTGGAIRAAGRADIYMGVGPDAEQTAGHQYSEGRLYYFFVKPERVQPWLDALHAAQEHGGKSPGLSPRT